MCVLNGTDLQNHQFSFQDSRLEITKQDGVQILTDGFSYLHVGAARFKAEGRWWQALKGLASDKESLIFDWGIESGPGSSVIGVARARHADESYVVKRDLLLPGLQLGSTTIESAPTCKNFDADLMFACLAFFWARFEVERLQS